MVIYRSATLDHVFHALADPTRRRLVEQLARQSQPVMELARAFSISQPAVTKHLGVLERAGLIVRRKVGRQRICELKPAVLSESIRWVERCRAFWTERLNALEEYIAEIQTKTGASR
jgi:DNA-binding transcriptional ArsR family regulator